MPGLQPAHDVAGLAGQVRSAARARPLLRLRRRLVRRLREPAARPGRHPRALHRDPRASRRAAAAARSQRRRVRAVGRRLLETHDRQRHVQFRYWRCPAEHGRLTTFVEFLREKDFVRPLAPAELADCRRGCKTVRCDGCGAAVDLQQGSLCYCRSPVSTLDPAHVERVVRELRAAEESARPRRPDSAGASRDGSSGRRPVLSAGRTRVGPGPRGWDWDRSRRGGDRRPGGDARG